MKKFHRILFYWSLLVLISEYCFCLAVEGTDDFDHSQSLSITERTRLSLAWSRKGLQTSTWPIDHGDSARSKFVFNAGLPIHVKEEEIELLVNNELKAVQWIYTGGNESQWIYCMSGDAFNGFWVNKLNVTSLKIIQRYQLQASLYSGGMVMHRNGHVYTIHTNKLYVFWEGNLANVTWITLPTELNGALTLTNGMLVSHDGYLVIKQFSWQFNDINLILTSKQVAVQLHYTFILISVLILYQYFRVRFKHLFLQGIISIAGGYFLGSLLALVILLLVMTVTLGGFNWFRFISDGLFSPNFGGGELTLIDPITLQVRVKAQLPERCSFPRMALSTIRNNEDGELEDVIILLGDKNVHQLRWRPADNALYWIPIWSREYRRNNDGTFPGTGPSIYNGMTYFTDNTFPIIGLKPDIYNFFAASIHHIPPSIPDKDHNRRYINYRTAGRVIVKDDYVRSDKMGMMPSWGHWKHFFQNNRYPMLPFDPMLHDHHDNQPGFMFWSTVINPPQDDYNEVGSVIVWDSSRSVVQARDLNKPSFIHWQLNGVSQADCISVVPDRHHVYLTDYGSHAPKKITDWLLAMSGELPTLHDKYFLIADTATGRIMLNITIPHSGIHPSLIVPGGNHDVLVGSQSGLIRLFSKGM